MYVHPAGVDLGRAMNLLSLHEACATQHGAADRNLGRAHGSFGLILGIPMSLVEDQSRALESFKKDRSPLKTAF